MQHEAAPIELGHELARAAHIDEHRVRGEDFLQHAAVGLVDGGGLEPRERGEKPALAARARRPVDLDDLGAVRREIARERRETEIHDAHRALKERADGRRLNVHLRKV